MSPQPGVLGSGVWLPGHTPSASLVRPACTFVEVARFIEKEAGRDRSRRDRPRVAGVSWGGSNAVGAQGKTA
jgi:hypothetical protein